MAKNEERSGFISRSRKLTQCEHKQILSQIIGPAAAGSAEPVPTPCGRHGAATVMSACRDNDDVVTVARRLARRRRRTVGTCDFVVPSARRDDVVGTVTS